MASDDVVNTVYGPMPSCLKKAALGELCEAGGVQTGPFGSQLHQHDYVENGTPIITVEHLGENRVIHQNLPCVSDSDKLRLDRYSLRAGDIVFSRVGSVDRRALVQPKEEGWLFSGRCLRVRPNKELLDSRWLSYFFGLPAFKSYIRGIAVGATMPSLNTKIMGEVPIYSPSIAVQAKAADFLTQIDDRIELLRQSNRLLDVIARAIFKSWFVDFDPVRAKAEGREPEGMDAATAALFPSESVNTTLGPVPDGWDVVSLGDLTEFAYGKPLKAESRNFGPVPVMGSNGRIGWHDEALVEGPGIVIGRKGNPGTVTWVHADFFPIDTTFYVRPKDLARGLYILKNQLELLNLPALSADSAVPGLNREMAYQTSLANPPKVLAECFEDLVGPLVAKIALNENSIAILAELRDTLLPRLISGKLRVPEAEKMLEAVL